MEEDDEVLDKVGSVWQEILEPIPDRWLNECFKLAAQDGKQVTPGEMIRAWSTLINNGTVAKNIIALPAGPPCDWCNGTGLRYRDKDGQELKWTDIGAGTGVTRCDHVSETSQA